MRIACLLFSIMLPATALHAQKNVRTTAPPFHALTLTTSNTFAPDATLLPGFPMLNGTPLVGYQGGAWIVNAAYPKGLAMFEPWQQNVSIPHGIVLAYKGGATGTFHCTTAASCAQNWEWFDLGKVPVKVAAGKTAPAGAKAAGYTCGIVPDDKGNWYLIPGMAALTNGAVMMRYRGGIITDPASWEGFILPVNGTAVANSGQGYGWCGAFFDGKFINFAPTSGGGNSITNLLRYDTTQPFQLSSLSSFDLSQVGGGTGPGTGTACCYESAAYDGKQNGYLIPCTSDLVVINTKQTFNVKGTYKRLSMSNLGKPGYPQVTGSGDLKAVQTIGAYIGAEKVWTPDGKTLWLYFAPFGPNPGGTHESTIVLTTVLRAQIGKCSPGIPGTQTCAGAFTPLDITAPTAIWEMFDLKNLTLNSAWSAARFLLPALFTTGSLVGQSTVGGYQLTWLNVHTPSDPVVGFVADYSNFYMRHHAGKSLSDTSAWDVAQRPKTQYNGIMGGPYDPISQTLYPSGPIAWPNPAVIQIGPL
jgi:hypothetical protein